MNQNEIERIKREFPEYAIDSLPPGIPDWLEADPWHNDVAPIWRDHSGCICLLIDYPDPKDREFANHPNRFIIWMTDDEAKTTSEVETNDFSAAVAELERLKQMKEPTR